MFLALLAFLATGRSASATPYEILYDANTDGVFPEDVGWVRITSAGGANRSVENGILTLDGLANNQISDQYRWNAMETLDPEPGEMFYAEWRMLLMPDSDSADVHVLIVPDGMERAFNLQIAVNGVGSTRDNQVAFIDTTIFRTYRLESWDMVDYAFYIDGDLAWEGFFGGGTTLSSVVRFGDGFIGSASGSEWDYFRFGVASVPAPGVHCVLILGCLVALRRRVDVRSHATEERQCSGPFRCWPRSYCLAQVPRPELSSNNSTKH